VGAPCRRDLLVAGSDADAPYSAYLKGIVTGVGFYIAACPSAARSSVGVTFALFVPGGLARYPLGGVVVFARWAGMSVWAIRSENEKRFRAARFAVAYIK